MAAPVNGTWLIVSPRNVPIHGLPRILSNNFTYTFVHVSTLPFLTLHVLQVFYQGQTVYTYLFSFHVLQECVLQLCCLYLEPS